MGGGGVLHTFTKISHRNGCVFSQALAKAKENFLGLQLSHFFIIEIPACGVPLLVNYPRFSGKRTFHLSKTLKLI